MTLTLYSTEACHLCERALKLLGSMPELHGHEVDVVDIAEWDDLLAHYGAVIPVLSAGRRELRWPFNADDVLSLLDAGAR